MYYNVGDGVYIKKDINELNWIRQNTIRKGDVLTISKIYIEENKIAYYFKFGNGYWTSIPKCYFRKATRNEIIIGEL